MLGLALALPLAAGCAQTGLDEPAAPATSSPTTSPKARPRLLVLTKTAGFRHDSIPAGVNAIQQIAERNKLTTTVTEDPSVFTDATLTAAAAVIFLNTTGDALTPDQEAALQRYVLGGGGFAGIHAASDTEHGWAFYGELIGARFADHPPGVQKATTVTEDRDHPSTAGLPARWERTDEWYNFDANPRQKVHVLAHLDESTYSGGTMGDHPIAWCHLVGKGRSWYTAGGHTSESYSEPLFLDHLRGGILWAAGLEPGICE